jgi:hypothetical protein
MYCKKGKSKPINTNLYNSIKKKVKARSKVWPSAYASGQLVREYKSKGGKYKCAGKNAHGSSFGSLDRWFKEEWVDLCKPKKNGKYQKCGRSKSQRKGYPYCRPLKRINSKKFRQKWPYYSMRIDFLPNRTKCSIGPLPVGFVQRYLSKTLNRPYATHLHRLIDPNNI